jgi:hypothetical protein
MGVIAIPGGFLGVGRTAAGEGVAADWILQIVGHRPRSPLDLNGGLKQIIRVGRLSQWKETSVAARRAQRIA